MFTQPCLKIYFSSPHWVSDKFLYSPLKGDSPGGIGKSAQGLAWPVGVIVSIALPLRISQLSPPTREPQPRPGNPGCWPQLQQEMPGESGWGNRLLLVLEDVPPHNTKEREAQSPPKAESFHLFS